MRIIISPAKKMVVNDQSLPYEGLPVFLERTQTLLDCLRALSFDECKALWGCNEKLARMNYERVRHMDLHRGLTPAILSYEGIQYQYMAADVLEQASYEYLQEHLRILSGFYGVLRPLDGVTPYRLEMQAKLHVKDAPDLYAYWGSALYADVMDESRIVVNLASVEYAKCITRYAEASDTVIDVVFGELVGGKVVQKGTLAKMARGEMVRFMASRVIEDIDEIKEFHALDYEFAPNQSNRNKYVFLKRV